MIYLLIPSRLESTRLPNKALADINGKPMIWHVANQSKKSIADYVVVCTDSTIIAKASECSYCITSSSHSNGTERIAEAAKLLNIQESDIIIDVQGDEPLVNPNIINRVINFMTANNCDIVVPHYCINPKNDNINRVKIEETNGIVTSMSRTSNSLKKHLNVIGFRLSALKRFANTAQTKNEKQNNIELLRALDIGLDVRTYKETYDCLSVDVKEDLDYIRCLSS